MPAPRLAPPAVTLCLAGLLASLPGASAGVAEISIAQATAAAGQPLARPTVGVGSGTAGALPFHVALTHRCPAGTTAAQLFVAVADTSRLVDAGPAGELQVVTLPVPLRQLLWLGQTAATCRTVAAQRSPDDVSSEGLQVYRLHAGTTGFATLACNDAAGKTVSLATSSTPLDVWLSCPSP